MKVIPVTLRNSPEVVISTVMSEAKPVVLRSSSETFIPVVIKNLKVTRQIGAENEIWISPEALSLLMNRNVSAETNEIDVETCTLTVSAVKNVSVEHDIGILSSASSAISAEIEPAESVIGIQTYDIDILISRYRKLLEADLLTLEELDGMTLEDIDYITT